MQRIADLAAFIFFTAGLAMGFLTLTSLFLFRIGSLPCIHESKEFKPLSISRRLSEFEKPNSRQLGGGMR